MSTNTISTLNTGLFGGVGTQPRKARALKDLNAIANAIGVMYTIFKHYFLNLSLAKIPPAAVVGGVPLPHIEELSGAISNLFLKYRATGGVFLAHQSGGEESLRIVGKAFGPNRFIFLDMIQFLFVYGSSTTIDYFKNFEESLVTEFEMEVTTNPWIEFQRNSKNQGLVDAHKTFPVVTKNRIYMSMYIETYTYEEKIELGMETVTYTIFFRKFDAFAKHKFAYKLHPKTGQKLVYYKEVEQTYGRIRDILYTVKPLLVSWFFTTFVVPNEYNPVSIGNLFTIMYTESGLIKIDLDEVKRKFMTNAINVREYFL